MLCELLSTLECNYSVALHIALVTHKNYLCIIPAVCLYLCHPKYNPVCYFACVCVCLCEFLLNEGKK